VRQDAGTPLGGVQVRLSQVNGSAVLLQDVDGALVAVVDTPGVQTVLGTQRDVVTTTNDSGDFNFYSPKAVLAGPARLQASFPGFLDEVIDIVVAAGARNSISFALFPA
jgi:hypothetical protein